MMNTILKEYSAQMELPIQWGDMDAAQHVNNIMYLRYSESARIQYMKDMGIPFDLKGKGIILAEVQIKYKFPITFPDNISIGTRAVLESMDEYGFWTEQVILSQKYNRIAAVVRARLVCYDFALLSKTPLSNADKQMIIDFEEK